MALRLWKLFSCENVIKGQQINVRYGHHVRGKPPGVARSLEQRLKETNTEDPSLNYRVNIGFPELKPPRSKQVAERLAHLKQVKRNPELEKATRACEHLINLEDVNSEWLKTSGQYHIKTIADHYGIYEHLFGDAYFIPRVNLNIAFNVSNDANIPVYYGNVIEPRHAQQKPTVSFKSDPNDLWTLVLTNPDGHFTKQESEYVHWFVGNIPGGIIEKGETIVEYLQPFPPKGIGYQRLIFMLYKQNKKIDYNQLKRTGPCLELEQRTFSTYDFYKEQQDFITPAGLAFFQSEWDSSLTDFFHNVLEMREPVFEYDFPPPYIRPQTWFPLRQPFNLYMDKYRDPKKVSEEYLIQKLKKTHPFKGPQPELPYPNAEPIPKHIPSWLRTEIQKNRLKMGRINDV